jgi:hypothetical protein
MDLAFQDLACGAAMAQQIRATVGPHTRPLVTHPNVTADDVEKSILVRISKTGKQHERRKWFTAIRSGQASSRRDGAVFPRRCRALASPAADHGRWQAAEAAMRVEDG